MQVLYAPFTCRTYECSGKTLAFHDSFDYMPVPVQMSFEVKEFTVYPGFIVVPANRAPFVGID